MNYILTITVLVLSVVLLCYGPVKVQATDGTVDEESSWSYDDIPAWGELYPICNNGTRQSPIALRFLERVSSARPINFQGYNVPLTAPVTLYNDGHSVAFDIPTTTQNRRASISGGTLKGTYQAIGAHFHWGSSDSTGAEHTIAGVRHDSELHIVHRNTKYATTEEALEQPDGLAVVAILLRTVDSNRGAYTGLDQIFAKLPDVVTYESKADIAKEFRLSQLIGGANKGAFNTYEGSLTTPPCSEAVTFVIFPQPLRIIRSQMELFWNILGRDGEPLLNNYRPLQERGNRLVRRNQYVTFNGGN